MHEKYGPVVRINPYELHVIDPAFLEEIFPGPGRKRDKWEWTTKGLGVPGATLFVLLSYYSEAGGALEP
jgi:hypothetical protein